jgi:hypothetical protein
MNDKMTDADEKARELVSPSVPTLKRLFARSGNKCAFPKCPAAIIDGETVVGEVCHIKGKPGGPRYDPNQTAAERHGHDNLILLCGNHHTVIDDDEEAYTVQRLRKMKSGHELRGPSISDEFASKAVGLLIDNSVTTLNQSGGITANSITINNYATPSKTESVPASSSKGFPAAEPKNGQARFRILDQPLGVHWNTIPYVDEPEQEIFLSAGPAMWLRAMPRFTPKRSWSADELLKCATRGNIILQPFLWTTLHYLRSEDGFGTYSSNGIRASETNSVAFAFETGEVWSVDTSLLTIDNRKNLYFLEIAQALVKSLRNYSLFLQNLGEEPPFDWVAGLEGVKGWRLQLPTPHGRASAFAGNICLSDAVIANGTYDVNQTSGVALRPFFNQLFRKCATECPEFVKSFIEKPLP